MPANFRNIAGVDFDDLFDADVMGDGPQAAAFKRLDGEPLRYASIAYGSKGADVGFRDINNNDLSNLWAAKGTAMYTLPINGQTFSLTNMTPNQQQGSAGFTFFIRPDGTYEARLSPTHGVTPPARYGTWLPAGSSAADFEVRFTRTHTGGNANANMPYNQAAAFVSCSAERAINLVVGPNGHASGSRLSLDSIKVELRRVSTGAIVSTTNFNTSLETDGSV